MQYVRSDIGVFLALLIVAALVAMVFGVSRRGMRVEQPIAFNHALHIEKAGLECTYCHTDAADRMVAGLPGKENCLDCHDLDEEADSHPEKAKLVPYVDSEDEIPWIRVAVTRPDVFFSHRRHVAVGEIDCLECHTDQDTITTPPPAPRLVMTMDDCIACHERNGSSTDCLACHR